MNIRKRLIESIEEYDSDDRMNSFIIDEDSFTNTGYPEAFKIEDLNGQKNYAAKKRYLDMHLSKIGSGSGRIVYYVDNTKCIKLAKNEKGLAQNRVESQGYIQNEFSDVVALVLSSDDNNYWHEMELAKKISPKRFTELTGLGWNEYCWMIRCILGPSKTDYTYGTPTQEQIDTYYEHEFAGQILDMAGSIQMPAGDFQRISTYGEILRNGKVMPVIVDYGLDESVWNDYYSPKPKVNRFHSQYN